MSRVEGQAGAGPDGHPGGPGAPGAAPEAALGEYRARRHAGRTPEPGTAPPGGGPSPETAGSAVRDDTAGPVDHTGDDQAGRGDTFVVQEHHARALHWDVRLERDGVLVSWAVPKGLPVEESTNHLAKRTEDHPLDYADFAGTIPTGEYGAGTVTIWDRGTYELEEWTDDKVKVVLHGTRVAGRYVFFRTRGADWMVHRMDPPQDPDRQPMPSRLEPMLAVRGKLPSGDGWAYEIKWDGVRVLAFVDGGRVTARARSGRDVTAAYPELRALGRKLGSTQAVLDGEIVAFGAAGTPDFGLLSHRMHVTDPAAARRLARRTPVTYLVFDLLFVDGHPTMSLTYDERRELLARLPGLEVPEAFPGDGDAVLRAISQAGMEGVVAKRRSSPYQPGRRSADWVKVKSTRRQTVVIGGWEPGSGARRDRIGALLVGVATPAGFRYAGQVGTGFTDAMLDRLAELLAPLRRDDPPFPDVPAEYARDAVWVAPELLADVEYGSWTADGRLRHPAFKGLRDDVPPSAAEREG
jgi:bifunctional non-homologous end joining protein LigD